MVINSMNCGNPNCKYELFSQEKQYFICPNCGNVIEDNLRNNPYENIKEVSLYYIQRKKLIRTIKMILAMSPFIIDFVVSDILLRKYRFMFIFKQQSKYTITSFLLPIFIAMIIYKILNRENKILVSLFDDKAFYLNSGIATIIKAVVYVSVMLFMLQVEVAHFKKFLVESDKYYSLYTSNQIYQGIDNLVGEHIFLTIYSFIAFYIMELLDMYQHNLIKRINES